MAALDVMTARPRLKRIGDGKPWAETVAIFPGSFKPPHCGHVHGIRYLLSRPDITRVVVIISNRCRTIPGTAEALDAAAARRLLAAMLPAAGIPMARVRIDIARHRATTGAAELFDEVERDTRLLFFVGAPDAHSKDDRFSVVSALSKTTGIKAGVEVLPPALVPVHASELRRFLGDGEMARSRFCDALPAEMDGSSKTAIWRQCQRARRPVAEIVKPIIGDSLPDDLGIHTSDLIEVRSDCVDPVFEDRKSGRIIKYAGDTTCPGAFNDSLVQKPAARLAVERRALRHLSTHLYDSLSIPSTQFFDPKMRISVLSGQPADAMPISDALLDPHTTTDAATSSARLLVAIHGCARPELPFWRNEDGCHGRWASHIASLKGRVNGMSIGAISGNVMDQCAQEAPDCIVHLDYRPAMLWFDGCRAGISGFEQGCSAGDRAFDVATFISDCIVTDPRRPDSCGRSSPAHAFMETYLAEAGRYETTLLYRVYIYAAFLLAESTASRKTVDCRMQRLVEILSKPQKLSTVPT